MLLHTQDPHPEIQILSSRLEQVEKERNRALAANRELICQLGYLTDLVQACKDLVAYLDKHPPMGDSLWSVQQIRAALKKAEWQA